MTIHYTLPTFSDFLSSCSTRESTISFLIEKGIISAERTCICDHQIRPNAQRHKYRCTLRRCNKEVSVYVNSFFAGAKIPCNKVLEIAYFWLSKASATQIATYTGISGKTVQAYVGHLQQLTADSLEDEDFVVGGNGIVVEVDETKLGKRKYNRGHRVEGVWVFCSVERTLERKIFVKQLENRNSATLTELILRHIHPGSIIVTDCWRGYSDLTAYDLTHITVNHSIEFKNNQTGACTNAVEGNNNALKMLIPPRKRTKKVNDTLWEFIWRRKNENDLWNGFISALQMIEYT